MPISVKQLVLFALRSEFKYAADAFRDLQNPTNWKRLEDAMWALQFAQQQTEENLAKLTSQWSPIGWPEHFAAAARKNSKVQNG